MQFPTSRLIVAVIVMTLGFILVGIKEARTMAYEESPAAKERRALERIDKCGELAEKGLMCPEFTVLPKQQTITRVLAIPKTASAEASIENPIEKAKRECPLLGRVAGILNNPNAPEHGTPACFDLGNDLERLAYQPLPQ